MSKPLTKKQREELIKKIIIKDGGNVEEDLKEALQYYNQDPAAGFSDEPYPDEELEDYAENGSL